MNELNDIKERLRKFSIERDWDQFHDAKNLALALSIEAATLQPVPHIFEEPADARPKERLYADYCQHDDENNEQHDQDDAHHDVSGVVSCQLIALEPTFKRF